MKLSHRRQFLRLAAGAGNAALSSRERVEWSDVTRDTRRREGHVAINIGGGTAKVVYRVGSVGEQTAVSGIVRVRIDRRCLVSGRRQYDLRAMRGHECTRYDDKAASRLAPEVDDGLFDLYVIMNGRHEWHDLEALAIYLFVTA